MLYSVFKFIFWLQIKLISQLLWQAGQTPINQIHFNISLLTNSQISCPRPGFRLSYLYISFADFRNVLWKTSWYKGKELSVTLLQCPFCYFLPFLLYRYWWNTRIFPFTKKSFLHRAQWRYYFYLSRLRMLVSPWLLTWSAKTFVFFIRILTFWNRKYKYYCLYFSFITLYPSFVTFLWQAICDRWPL